MNEMIRSSRTTYLERTEELERLKSEVQRLRRIVRALMHGYSSICEADFRTGQITFLQLSSSAFIGLPGKLPPWDDTVSLYVANGVFPEDRPAVRRILDRKYLMEHLEYGGSVTLEYRNQSGVYGEVKIVRLDNENIIAAFTEKDLEITERKEQVYSDSLTHVRNRKYYDECLAPQSCQALVMADVDRFKDVNDAHGHLCGDAALAAASAALHDSVRDMDDVVRYGGDEFLIVFREITPEALRDRLEHIRRAVEDIRLDGYPQVRLSMSFGATYGSGQIRDMLPVADELLYEAKKARNTVAIRPFSDSATV